MKVYYPNVNTFKSFSFYLRRSTYIHLLLVVVAVWGGEIAFEERRKLEEKNLELIQASVRVDMVAMPTYTLKELKNLSSGVEDAKKEEAAPVSQETKKEVIEKKEVVEKTIEKDDGSLSYEEGSKKKRKDFLSKLKEIGNKKVNSDGTQKAEKGVYGDKATALKQLVLAGNKLSQGSQMYGDGNGAEMTAFQVYASRLPDIVRPHWRLPSFLMDKKLKCRIRVWLSKNGELLRSEVYQSSGDSEYDQRAIEAVRGASPFPRLSEEYSKRGMNGDILLGFPL